MIDGQPPQAETRKKSFMTERRNGGIRIRPDLLGILLVLVIHIATMAWWASRTTTRVDHLEENDAQAAEEYRLIRETQVQMLTELSALSQSMANYRTNDGG